MAKRKVAYCCAECGYDTPQWLGKCPQCGVWNSFKEITLTESRGGRAAITSTGAKKPVQPLATMERMHGTRFSVGSEEFDRVLGGGMYAASTVLLAGEPGIGKSTLLIQTSAHVAAQSGRNVLYIAAEESVEQVKDRADRLQIPGDGVYVVSEVEVAAIIRLMDEVKPLLVIVDSVQAINESAVPGAPGTVTQVRECALSLCRAAKERQSALFLIGHVTKDGTLAGPRSLEHLVDTVVYFEGDRYQSIRMVRAIKNRFGATGEIGIFDMTAQGLRDEKNPSHIFLSTHEETTTGHAIVAVVEGKRPFIVEVQALTNPTPFNNPLRRTVGVEANKIALLIAVLERSLGAQLSHHDVFIKAVGGLYLEDAGCDVALAMAILSSLKDVPVSSRVVFVGEIGLGGEVRKVGQVDARIKEAARLGFETIVVPKNNVREHKVQGITVLEVGHIRDVVARFLVKEKVRK